MEENCPDFNVPDDEEEDPKEFHHYSAKAVRQKPSRDVCQREVIPCMAQLDSAHEIKGTPCEKTRRMIRVHQLTVRHAKRSAVYTFNRRTAIWITDLFPSNTVVVIDKTMDQECVELESAELCSLLDLMENKDRLNGFDRQRVRRFSASFRQWLSENA